MADSGKMYTILNAQYLKFELFKGYRYTEGSSNEKDISGRQATGDNSTKTKFTKMQVVFDLSSFGLARTDKKWFQGNRIMRNTPELDSDMDSIKREMDLKELEVYNSRTNLFKYPSQGRNFPNVLRRLIPKLQVRRVRLLRKQRLRLRPRRITKLHLRLRFLQKEFRLPKSRSGR
jgi:hypothetical protein